MTDNTFFELMEEARSFTNLQQLKKFRKKVIDLVDNDFLGWCHLHNLMTVGRKAVYNNHVKEFNNDHHAEV